MPFHAAAAAAPYFRVRQLFKVVDNASDLLETYKESSPKRSLIVFGEVKWSTIMGWMEESATRFDHGRPSFLGGLTTFFFFRSTFFFFRMTNCVLLFSFYVLFRMTNNVLHFSDD